MVYTVITHTHAQSHTRTIHAHRHNIHTHARHCTPIFTDNPIPPQSPHPSFLPPILTQLTHEHMYMTARNPHTHTHTHKGRTCTHAPTHTRTADTQKLCSPEEIHVKWHGKIYYTQRRTKIYINMHRWIHIILSFFTFQQITLQKPYIFYNQPWIISYNYTAYWEDVGVYEWVDNGGLAVVAGLATLADDCHHTHLVIGPRNATVSSGQAQWCISH